MSQHTFQKSVKVYACCKKTCASGLAFVVSEKNHCNKHDPNM